VKNIIYFLSLISILSCSDSSDDPTSDISGCTDPNSINYNPDATVNDNSCQYPVDNSDDTISGCTDPNSINYNPDATVNDNSCQYSIIGEWSITKYTVGPTNVAAAYSSMYMDIFNDRSMLFDFTLLDGSYLLIIGEYTVGGSNNSRLTITNEFGDKTIWDVIEITSNSIKLYSSDVLGQEANIEAIKF
jgi:hypothetical protein